MNKEKNFETYISIEKNKFKIFLFDKIKLKNLYKEEISFKDDYEIDVKKLNKFLDDNIFKIEKLINQFIQNVFLIIEHKKELEIDICIKKKNFNDVTNRKNLNQALVDIKDLFKDNNEDKFIMHMIINSYIINEKKYFTFIDESKSDYLCLDVKFITLQNKYLFKFHTIFEKYQISISQFISGKYIRQILDNKDFEISEMAHEIRNGYNSNEIIIVPKNTENKGFFEKFFQLFS